MHWQPVVSFLRPISFALPDPIQGQSATSLRTDDLFYTATACGGLVFTQPCLLQEPVGGLLDGLSPFAALFAAMGEVWLNRTQYVKLNRTFLIEFVVM